MIPELTTLTGPDSTAPKQQRWQFSSSNLPGNRLESIGSPPEVCEYKSEVKVDKK